MTRIDGQRSPVVVAGTVKKYTASKRPSSSLAALVETKALLLDRPSTGRSAVGREGHLSAGHRVEAREEVARVRLAVGDIGIGGLEVDHKVGVVRTLGRLEGGGRSEVRQGGARDLGVVGRGEPVGPIGEAQVEPPAGRTGHRRRRRGSVEDNGTRRAAHQRPEIERLAETHLRRA